MATRTVTALFDTYADAAEAVRQLEAAGVPHGDVAIVSRDASHALPGTDPSAEPDAEHHLSGTGAGASVGTLLGGGAGLLAGLGFLAVPGLGPVVAAGWIASTLVGAGVGAAAGGVVGALTDAGVSEGDAELYMAGLHRGGTLVTARVAGLMIEPVTEILARESAVDLSMRAPELGDAILEEGQAPDVLPVGDPALAAAGIVPGPEPEHAAVPNPARSGSHVAGDVSASLPPGTLGSGGSRIGIVDKP